jgi:rhamnosyltransferase subunit B
LNKAIQHALLVTKGTLGDIVPFLALGQTLRHAGWQVTLCTHAAYGELAAAVDVRFVPCDTSIEFDEFLADGALLESPAGIETFARKHVVGRIRSEVGVLRSLCSARPTVLLHRYMSGFAAPMVAELVGVPLVTVFTAVAQALTRRLFQQICRVRLAAEINMARADVGLAPVVSWNDWLDGSDLHLACWPSWFGKIEPALSTVEYLGFMTADAAESGPLPPTVCAALAGEPAPVLITGGTARWKLAQRFYHASAHGCALAGQKAILVTRYPDLVPNPLPAGIEYYDRLPFGTLMPHVAAVIHHGGTSVLVRAILAQIPQLAMPFGADRPDTASRLAELGVARCLLPPQWDSTTVAASLTSLLSDPCVRRACGELSRRVETSARLKELPELLGAVAGGGANGLRRARAG